MNAGTSNVLRAILGMAVLGGCLVAILVVAGLLWLRGQPTAPDVVLYAPPYGTTVRVGEVVEVRAAARHSRGVARVELWVDGELIAVETSQLPEGSTPFPITKGWVPQTTGRHTLVVRAYDRSQGSGQTTTVVEAEEGLPPEVETSYVVQEGDTLASVADLYGFSAEDLAAANPGMADPLPAGMTLTLPPPIEDEGPPPTPEPMPEPLPGEAAPDPAFTRAPTLLERLIPVGRPASEADVRIQVEVLSLEVSDDFDGVYCYYAPGEGAMERVPAEGYFEPAGGRAWAIEPWMAGDRRRVFVLPEGSESLAIRAQCLGYRHSTRGGEVFDLGTLVLTLGAAEWDGSLREAMAEGRDGWFRIQYHIASWTGLGSPPPRPSVAETEAGAPVLLSECQARYIGEVPLGSLGVEVEIGRFFAECTLWVDPASLPVPVNHVVWIRQGGTFTAVREEDSTRLTLMGIVPALPAGTDAAYAMYYHFGLTEETSGLPGPDDVYEFRARAWRDDGTYSADSNVVTINGRDLWPSHYARRNVRLTVTELDTGCLHADFVPLPTGGLQTWGIGERDLDANGHPIVENCEHDLDSWGSVSGGLDANGRPVFRVDGPLHSATHYRFPEHAIPSITLNLAAGEDLVLAMELWDYDVWSSNDPFCNAVRAHSGEELEEIRESGGSYWYRGAGFVGEEGDCYLHYRIDVWN